MSDNTSPTRPQEDIIDHINRIERRVHSIELGLHSDDSGIGNTPSLLTGIVPPITALGTDGDSYLDLVAKAIYVKSAGVWSGPTSLAGASISTVQFLFEIDSIGIKTLNIPHGLSSAPSDTEIMLVVKRDTNVNDWSYD
jgi:hypothetical protein